MPFILAIMYIHTTTNETKHLIAINQQIYDAQITSNASFMLQVFINLERNT